MSRRSQLAIAAVAVVVLASTSVGMAAASGGTARKADAILAHCPWMDTSLSATARADLLLKASTLDQKIRWLDEQAANSPAQTTFGGVTYPVQVPCTPTVVYTDGPDYVRLTHGVTNFPAQISLAATWDPALAYAKGAAMADEAFRSGKNGILGPAVISGRTPLDGRTPEYLGEDPLLGGLVAAAQINGIQDGNPNEPVLAVLKHWVANEQELDRQLSSSNMDGRTLQEVYNLPFAIALSRSSPARRDVLVQPDQRDLLMREPADEQRPARRGPFRRLRRLRLRGRPFHRAVAQRGHGPGAQRPEVPEPGQRQRRRRRRRDLHRGDQPRRVPGRPRLHQGRAVRPSAPGVAIDQLIHPRPFGTGRAAR